MKKIRAIIPDNLGKGIKYNPVTKKWEANVDNSTITINEQGQLVGAPQSSGGLNCAEIAALPKTAWKPNTSILVNQGGECKRLVPNENIFTDVVVDLAASKQNVEIPKNQSETVNIIATVTNAGSNPTGEVLVTLTKPQLGTYRLGTPTTNNIGETKTGELTWKVPTMASGKSLVITLPVTFSKVGSFSFGLQATSTIDTNTQNNTKTMTFTVTERIVNDGTNTNYVPTGKDCPLIIATDLTHNKRMNVFTMPIHPDGTVMVSSVDGDSYRNVGRFFNIFSDGRGFAGKKIKLEGASTVVVTGTVEEHNNSNSSYFKVNERFNYYTGKLNSQFIKTRYSTYRYVGSAYSPSKNMVVAMGLMSLGKDFDDENNYAPTDQINLGTFDPQTQIFTFRSDLKLPTRETSYDNAPYSCVLWCRPAGKDCKWQGIPIVLGIRDVISPKGASTITIHEFTKIHGNVEFEGDREVVEHPKYKAEGLLKGAFIGEQLDDLVIPSSSLYAYSESSETTRINKSLVVTVTPGQEAKFSIRSLAGYEFSDLITTGKIKTSFDKGTNTLTVTVAADATPTDSIFWRLLKIIVK